MHSSFLYPFLILQILNPDFIIPNLNIFLFLSLCGCLMLLLLILLMFPSPPHIKSKMAARIVRHLFL